MMTMTVSNSINVKALFPRHSDARTFSITDIKVSLSTYSIPTTRRAKVKKVPVHGTHRHRS